MNDPKLTELLDAMRREADPAKRVEIAKQAVRIVNGDMMYGQAIIYTPHHKFWQPYLKVYQPNYWRAGE